MELCETSGESCGLLPPHPVHLCYPHQLCGTSGENCGLLPPTLCICVLLPTLEPLGNTVELCGTSGEGHETCGESVKPLGFTVRTLRKAVHLEVVERRQRSLNGGIAFSGYRGASIRRVDSSH